jgi:hypothetical protein
MPFTFKFRSGAALAAAVLLTGCHTHPSHPGTPGVGAAPAPAPAAAPPLEPTQAALVQQAAQLPAADFGPGAWQSLFNGRDLAGWQVTDFTGRGPVAVQDGLLVFNAGNPFSGIHRASPPATLDYEVAFDALRLAGSDFFCALTFPVGTNCCSLIVGGWGGGCVGISSLDGYDASENETTTFQEFTSGRWYRIRVRVTRAKIQAWIDAKQVVNVAIAERKIAVRPGDIESSQPFGLAAFSTAAAFRELRWRQLSEEPAR